MRGPRLVIVLLVSVLSAGLLFQAPAGAGMLSWNLAEDFSVSPYQANPNADQYGNPDVWYFMEGRAQDTSSYALLSSFVSDAFAVDGLEQWQGPFDPGDPNAGLPAVGINATGIDQHPTTFTWPAGAIRIHPLLRRSVVVGWQSPIDGAVEIDASFNDMDITGGNGIRWAALLKEGSFETLLATGINGNGGGGGFSTSLVFLSKGDFIYFIVGSYRGDYSFDSTQLDVTITQVQA
jgi:hypothetical protein